MFENLHDGFWDAVGIAIGEGTISHPGYFYQFHKKQNFTSLFADCGEYSAYLGYAIWCRNQGYYETAYEYLKIAVHDRTGLSRLEMARVCFVLGKYEEAIQYSEMFQDENIYSYNFYQGLAYYKLGQIDKCTEIMKDLAETAECDVGDKEARAFLENGLGIKEEWNANNVLEGIHLKFSEAPRAHIIYLAIAIPVAIICRLIITRYAFWLRLISLLPLIYYAWIAFSRLDRSDYTVENMDKVARRRNTGIKCKCRSGFEKREYILFPALNNNSLYIPREKDYTDTVKPSSEKTRYELNRELDSFYLATQRWESDIVNIINNIRKERIKILLDKYSRGEQMAAVTDALKYLFDIEIVNGEIKYLERKLPFACISDMQKIESMYKKTEFTNDNNVTE